MRPETDILDHSPSKEPAKPDLEAALKWWENMRPWYNLIVAAAGLISLVVFAVGFHFLELILLFIYALAANLMYSLAFLAESFNWHYLRGKLPLNRFRQVFFVLGTIGSVGLTFILCPLYYEIVYIDPS